MSGVPQNSKTPAFFFGAGETFLDVSALIEGSGSRYNEAAIFNFRR